MSDEETSSFDEGSTDTGSTEESTDEETTDDNQGETSFRVQGENTFTVQASQGNQGQQIYNKPHDEEFGVEDDTAAGNQQQYQQQQQQPQQQQRQQYGADSSMVANQPHDEEFDVQDGDIPSPDKNNNGRGGGAPRPGGPTRQPGGSHGTMANDHHDEFEDVENDVTDDDEAQQTPPRGHQQQQPQQQQNQNRPGGQRAPDALQTSQLQNMPHDEEFPVSGNSPTTTDNSSPNQSPQQQQRPQGGKVQPITNNPNVSGSTQQRPTVNSLPHNMQQQQQQRKQPQGSTDEDTDTDTDTDDDGDNVPTNMRGNMPLATSTTATSGTQQQVKEYNPADYEHVNRKVSQEVRDLFSAITDYQPVTVECPAKLRPFIPDFIPSVGDIETFCKIPRPDGRPDNLGLAVVDEPSSNQSNPAVVKIGLAQTSKVRAPQTVVDSVENAHSSPQVIDKWINDIKELQYKKPLPTVSYSKPMPEIEQLIQVWPPEFEEILASDVQLPPPGIDLNMVDYVKLLCSILDIPTHGNIIESLHVLFCTYLEFRMNQHFQHA